ncbi:zinc finger CHY domain-containing protein [Pyrenochaeta sp. MPI-SDFR-AT-0127]|nr:zinc finger CHY domain-containing protein [Pyrenochaeta sp. MPI-SDFR-AT-0127]
MSSPCPQSSQSEESPVVRGLSVTPLTQCLHWHSALDIIAIKHFCCNTFYACISCHDACEPHKSGAWPRSQRGERAVLCGRCKYVLSIEEYMASGSRCTRCESGFNPGCKGHWGLYFEADEKEAEN